MDGFDIVWKTACTDPAFICWIEEHPGLASWVQAIGSIAAILAAVGVAWMGVREQRLQSWRKERAFLKESIIVLKWMILDAQGWLIALKAGDEFLGRHIEEVASRDGFMADAISKLALRSADECPDPIVRGAISRLPEWRQDSIRRARGVLNGTVSLHNQATTLGALELAEIHEIALNKVLKSSTDALKSLS